MCKCKHMHAYMLFWWRETCNKNATEWYKNVGNGNFSGFNYYLKVYARKPWDFILKKPCKCEFALIC